MQDVEGDVRKLNSQMSKSGGGMSSFAGGSERGLKSLGKWGSSLQWTGRQLGYNFTLPILAAGAAATKFALDQEKAMTRLRKVYGDASMSDTQRINETEALERAFVALSNRYGIAADEVANIGAEWAAAGASGRALAENVELTMKTMVLGELEAADATKALISTQAQYGLTAKELTAVMEQLNAVENQTGSTTGDLITAFQRTAGVARAAGVGVGELAGMIAALVPAAGTASQAGNALKTIIGRIMSPTGPATQLLREMGIATQEAGWQSMTATQRIETLARAFPKLTDAQKQVVGVTLASMHQTNRFETVLNAVAARIDENADTMSYYTKGLDAASDSVQAHETAQRELEEVLESSPQKMKQVGIILQNSMIRVIQPMIPMIVGAAQAVGSLAQKFGELNPNVQKLIVFGLLLLASLGLIARYVGAMATLIAVLGGAFGWFGGILLGTARFFGLYRAAATTQMAATTAAAGAHSAGTVAVMRAQFLKGFPGLLGLWTALRNGIIIRMVGLNIAVSTQIIRMRAWVYGQWMMMWTSMKVGMVVRITQMQAFLAATMVPSFIASITNLRIAVWARWTVMWSYMMAPVTTFFARMKAMLAVNLAALKLWATAGGVMSMWAAFWIRAQLVVGLAMARMRMLMLAGIAPIGAAISLMGTVILGALAPAMMAVVRFGMMLPALQVQFIAAASTVWYSAAIVFARAQMAIWNAVTVATIVGGRMYGLVMGGIIFPLQAMWVRGMAALPAATQAAWVLIIRVQMAMGSALAAVTATIGTATTAIWATMTASWLAIQRAFAAAYLAMTTFFWTAVIRIQLAAQALMTRMTAAFMTAVRAIAAVGMAAFAATMNAGSWLVRTVWLNMLIGMRLMWISFVTFIRTPGMLLAAFKGMGAAIMAGGRGIMAILAVMRTGIIAILTSPWGIAVLAVIGILMLFRDQIEQVWTNIKNYFTDANNGIVKAFDALPNGVRNAFLKVVAFVKAAATKVHEWMQYLNPFARHSPSLVDNVKAGMAVVRAQYGTLTQIAGPIGRAYAGIKQLNDASANLRKGAASVKLAREIEDLSKVAPRVVPAFVRLSNILTELEAKADSLQAVIDGQQQTVDIWKQALDDASDALSIQEDILDGLQDTAQGYQDQITDLKDAISDLASTPLQGIGAMEDQIFDNEMAQKRLRLEIMRMEDAGQSYQDVESRIASLNGEIESLRGIQNDLRAGGADASILKFYDDQITAIEQQKKSMGGQTAPIEEANNALKELERQAQIMDLTKSLEFDPLSRQIEKAASDMRELPFDEIIGGIGRNKAAIVPLEAAWQQANEAIRRQEGVVKAAQAAHDEIQAGYDAEQKKLDVLKDAYGRVSSAIQDVNSALSDMKAATDLVSEDAAGNISPQLQNFRDAASGADFPDPGGTAGLGREGIEGDQSALIDEFTAGIEDDMANAFGGLDMLQPFKDMWNGVVAWWDRTITPWFDSLGLGGFLEDIFAGVDWGAPFDELSEKMGNINFEEIFGTIGDIFYSISDTIVTFGENLWQWLGQPFQDTVGIIWDALQKWWDFITGLFSGGEGGGVFQGFLDAVLAVWNFAGPIFNWLAEGVMMFVSIIWSAFNGLLGPALDMLFGFFTSIWGIIGGLFDMIAGLFTGDWSRLWDGFLAVLGGIGGMLWSVISGIPSMLIGWIGGLISGIIPVGSAIIDGIWQGIQAGWDWFLGLLGGMWTGLIDWVKSLLGISSPSTVFAEIGGWLMEGLGAGISGMIDFVIGIFKFLWDAVSFAFQAIGFIIGLVVDAIVFYFNLFAAVASWLWDNVLSPIFGFIGDVFSWIWNSIIKPIIDLIVWYVGVWAAIFTWLWENVLSPVFGFIGDIFGWIWGIISFIIDLIVEGIKVWAGIISWIWDSIIKPVFGFIGDIFEWIYNNIILPIVNLIVDIVKTWAGIFEWIWNSILSPIFGWIGDAFGVLGDAIQWVWENIIKKAWDAVVNAAQWVWEKVTGFFDTMKQGISNIFTGIRDFVMGIWNGFRDMLVGVAQNIWDWIVEKFTNAKDNIVSIFTTIRDTISNIWNGVLDVLKTPVRWVLEFINDNIIGTLNSIIGVFGLEIPTIPINFATGGIVPGGYSPGRDNTLAAVGSGEAIMRPEWTRAMGADYVHQANNVARMRGADGVRRWMMDGMGAFADGGIAGGRRRDVGGPFDFIGDAASAVGRGIATGAGAVADFAGDAIGAVTDAVGDAASWAGDKVADLVAEGIGYALDKIIRPVSDWIKDTVDVPFVSDVMDGMIQTLADVAKSWGSDRDDGSEDRHEGGGRAGTGELGGNWQSIYNIVKEAIPQARKNSTLRPGDPGYHGRGKAVDFGFGTGPGGNGSEGMASIARFLYRNYGRNLAELIYTGIGDNTPDVKNGRDHTYNAGTRAGHKNHVHAAVYDLGGALRDGEVALNMSGGTERVLSPRQTAAFERLIDYLDLNGVPSVEALEGVIFKATQRATAAETIGSGDTVINNTGDTNITYNFYGDLEFPNITDGDDAEVFLNNLSDLAGGRR